MHEFTQGIFILLLVFNIEDIGISVRVVVTLAFIFDFLPFREHHWIHLLLPVLLVERFYILILIIEIILVLYRDLDSVVVVYCLSIFFIVHQAHLTAIAPLLSSKGNLNLIQRVYFVEVSSVLQRMDTLVFEGSLVDRNISNTFDLYVFLVSSNLKIIVYCSFACFLCSL